MYLKKKCIQFTFRHDTHISTCMLYQVTAPTTMNVLLQGKCSHTTYIHADNAIPASAHMNAYTDTHTHTHVLIKSTQRVNQKKTNNKVKCFRIQSTCFTNYTSFSQ